MMTMELLSELRGRLQGQVLFMFNGIVMLSKNGFAFEPWPK